MPNYKPEMKGKDHVLVHISLAVMIGVDEQEDDLPSDFCNQVREKIKETGATILTSSIVHKKRLHLSGSAREKIVKDNENPLFI